MNVYQVNFKSVYVIEDVSTVSMFKSLEASGLCMFPRLYVIIYEDNILEFCSNATITTVIQVPCILGGNTIIIDEALFASTFSLPNQELSDVSSLPQSIILKWSWNSLVLVTLFQCHVRKKKMMEFKVLVDRMSKSLMVRAGSFDASTKEKFLVMAAITTVVKVNWSSIILNVLVDVIEKRSIGFAIQLSKFLEIPCVSASQDLTKQRCWTHQTFWLSYPRFIYSSCMY